MRLWITAMLAFLTTACSPLAMFNNVIPKDAAAGQRQTGVAYGEHPRQRLDVYPGAGAGTAKPIIVFIYGGSWDSGRRQDYAWIGRALAAQGFLTVVPDYRLVPEVVYPDFLTDLATAVRWTRDNAARLGGDPDRIVLMGHSAGGYNTLMLALDRSLLERAGVPASAIRGAIDLSGPADFYPWEYDVARATFSQWPQPLETQPITYARADAPPLLVIHGAADTTVKPRNSESIAARMRAAGGRVEFKLIPGMDHKGSLLAFARPFRNKSTVQADTIAFARSVTQ